MDFFRPFVPANYSCIPIIRKLDSTGYESGLLRYLFFFSCEPHFSVHQNITLWATLSYTTEKKIKLNNFI